MSTIKTVDELKKGDVFLAPSPHKEGETVELTVRGIDGEHVLLEEMGGVDVVMDEYEVIRNIGDDQSCKSC
jgi:hypothetical protein